VIRGQVVKVSCSLNFYGGFYNINITVSGVGYIGFANALLLAQHNSVTDYDISAEYAHARMP
jgi:hypothetical protein